MTKPILDACCGGKMFHFDKSNPLVLFMDKRHEDIVFMDRGKTRTLEIAPDIVADFTNMPFADKSFNLVIFDPPHLIKGGDNSWLVKKYGRLSENWEDQLRKGFDECMRVLAENGVLVFKWNETQITVNKILSLISYKPIVGHKSGKLSNTHWLIFFKSR